MLLIWHRMCRSMPIFLQLLVRYGSYANMSRSLHSVVKARLEVYLRVWASEAEGRGAKRADMPQSSPRTEFHNLHISLCISKHCDISKQLDMAQYVLHARTEGVQECGAVHLVGLIELKGISVD